MADQRDKSIDTMEQLNVDGESAQRVCGQTKSFWKRFWIIGGVLVGAAVIAIIIVFTTTGGADPGKGFALDDALSPDFIPIPFIGSWGIDKLIYVDETNNIVGIDKHNNTISPVLPPNINFNDVYEWTISGDNKYVMVVENYTENVVGNGHTAFYKTFNVDSAEQIDISVNGQRALIQLAVWSPSGNGLVFVQNNALYYKPSVNSNPILVSQAQNQHQSVGICNFIYQSEIFFSDKAVWFSPSGTTVAFAVFDDSDVQHMRIPIYGEPGAIESQYPADREFSYPKTGTANPKVTLMYFSTIGVTNGVNLNVAMAPLEFNNVDHILTGISWASNVKLVSMWTNRVQNRAVIRTCELGLCVDVKRIILDNGWLEPNQPMVFNRNDDENVAMIEFREVDEGIGSFSHISITNLTNGARFFVTGGAIHVASIAHWDAMENLIFFHGNTDQDSHHAQLYVVRALANQLAQCITCDIAADDGIPQTVFQGQFDQLSNHFVLHINGPSIPSAALYSWSVSNNRIVDLTRLRPLQENTLIKTQIKDFAEPIVRYLDVPLSVGGGLSARVKLIIPKGVNLDGGDKFPLLVLAYAGPNSYTGSDEWSIGWGTYLASNKSVVSAIIDARGMGRRSDRYQFAGYRNLGTVEVEDQIEVAGKLVQQLPYVDKDRVGIWGWSYGGYVATMALAKDTNKVFRCGASVAGVTDWHYYNTMYTERYMGLPTIADNLAGYDRSSLLNQVPRLNGTSLYLIHGTLDDNVHYQQMMMLSRRLETADVQFDQMSYADESHPISGGQSHLYHGLNRFFGDCFGMEL